MQWHVDETSAARGLEWILVKRSLLFSLAIAVALLFGCDRKVTLKSGGPVADWPDYGNDPGGSRYSPLTQITKENVSQLKVAWTYRTGDVSEGKTTARKTSFEATPILVDGILYYVATPFNRLIALDAALGIRTDSHTEMKTFNCCARRTRILQLRAS